MHPRLAAALDRAPTPEIRRAWEWEHPAHRYFFAELAGGRVSDIEVLYIEAERLDLAARGFAAKCASCGEAHDLAVRDVQRLDPVWDLAKWMGLAPSDGAREITDFVSRHHGNDVRRLAVDVGLPRNASRLRICCALYAESKRGRWNLENQAIARSGVL